MFCRYGSSLGYLIVTALSTIILVLAILIRQLFACLRAIKRQFGRLPVGTYNIIRIVNNLARGQFCRSQ